MTCLIHIPSGASLVSPLATGSVDDKTIATLSNALKTYYEIISDDADILRLLVLIMNGIILTSL